MVHTIKRCGQAVLCLVLLLTGTVVANTAHAKDAATAPEKSSTIRRYDPMTQSLKPISEKKVIPGKIYNHYSARHRNYVWAYALPHGKWSYPLGPGTTELPEHFDLVTPPEITRALLEQRAGEWLARSRQEGSPILARLAADGHWELLQIRTIRSHFDLDSGYRWEWHGGHQIGVLHTCGRRWRFVDGKYYPLTY